VSAESPWEPRSFRVQAIRVETADTTTLWLEPSDGRPMAFAPGQFAMLGRPGHAEVPISMSGDPTEPALLQHTVRAVGDASRALARSRPGDIVLVRGPYGRGWDVERAHGGDIVLVAGGIGLAPLRPAILTVLRTRAEYRRLVVLYGSRTPDQLLFRRELQSWRTRDDMQFKVTVDAAPPSWRGRVGLITGLLDAADWDTSGAHVFVCGPEVMMRIVAETLVDRDVDPNRLHLSMERNMKCGIGLCGHCQLREQFVCVDGPVFDYTTIAPLLRIRGL
jgi:NAD(P)H-flavin reductase